MVPFETEVLDSGAAGGRRRTRQIISQRGTDLSTLENRDVASR